MCSSSDHTMRLQGARFHEKNLITQFHYSRVLNFVGAFAHRVIDKNYFFFRHFSILAECSNIWADHYSHRATHIVPQKNISEHNVEDAAANRYRAHSYYSAYECRSMVARYQKTATGISMLRH